MKQSINLVGSMSEETFFGLVEDGRSTGIFRSVGFLSFPFKRKRCTHFSEPLDRESFPQSGIAFEGFTSPEGPMVMVDNISKSLSRINFFYDSSILVHM